MKAHYLISGSAVLGALLLGETVRGDGVFDSLSSPTYPSSVYDNFSATITLAGEARLLTNVVFGCVYANLTGGDDFVSPSFTDTNGNVFFQSRPLPLQQGGYNVEVQLTLEDLSDPENPIPLNGPVPDTFTWSIGYSGTSQPPPWSPEDEMFFFPTVDSIAVGSGEPSGYWYPQPEEPVPYYLPVLFEAVVPEPTAFGLIILGLLGLGLARTARFSTSWRTRTTTVQSVVF